MYLRRGYMYITAMSLPLCFALLEDNWVGGCPMCMIAICIENGSRGGTLEVRKTTLKKS